MDVFTLPSESRSGPDVFRLWFHPTGRRLLVLTGHAGGANRLWNWDVPNGRSLGKRKVVNDPEHDNGFPFPAFSRTLRHMLFDDHVEDRRTRKRVKLEYVSYGRTLSPDGRTAFAVADKHLIDRFDLSWKFKGESVTVRSDKTRAIAQPGKDKKYVDALAVSPAGDLLAASTSDGKALLLFRLADGAALPPVELPVFSTDGERMTMEPYGRLVFSPDGQTVAVAGDGVCLADLAGGRPVQVLDERYFADLAFTPDGSRLVGVRPDGTAAEWDVAGGSAVRSFDLKALAGELRAVAVAPDGLTAVAGGSRGRLVRWDL